MPCFIVLQNHDIYFSETFLISYVSPMKLQISTERRTEGVRLKLNLRLIEILMKKSNGKIKQHEVIIQKMQSGSGQNLIEHTCNVGSVSLK